MSPSDAPKIGDDDTRPYRPGVGVVLMNGDGMVWVGERIRRLGRQMASPWQLPQGGLDDGEDPRAAAFRELEEETGVTSANYVAETDGWLAYDLPADVRDQVWKGRFRGQKQKWFVLKFTGDEAEIDLNTHHKPEFSAWRWADPAELPGLAVSFKRGLYEDLLTAFSAVFTDPAGKPKKS
ncbi:MAG: RNA pyrophosphohydrolase [Rhodospirillaceae bacterium]